MKLLLYRLAGAVLAAGMLIVAFVLASVFLAVIVAVGIVVWLFIWWRTRHLRAALRERQASVVEGEFRVEEGPEQNQAPLPRPPREPDA